MSAVHLAGAAGMTILCLSREELGKRTRRRVRVARWLDITTSARERVFRRCQQGPFSETER
jgi:hypothetical protein